MILDQDEYGANRFDGPLDVGAILPRATSKHSHVVELPNPSELTGDLATSEQTGKSSVRLLP